MQKGVWPWFSRSCNKDRIFSLSPLDSLTPKTYPWEIFLKNSDGKTKIQGGGWYPPPLGRPKVDFYLGHLRVKCCLFQFVNSPVALKKFWTISPLPSKKKLKWGPWLLSLLLQRCSFWAIIRSAMGDVLGVLGVLVTHGLCIEQSDPVWAKDHGWWACVKDWVGGRSEPRRIVSRDVESIDDETPRFRTVGDDLGTFRPIKFFHVMWHERESGAVDFVRPFDISVRGRQCTPTR